MKVRWWSILVTGSAVACALDQNGLVPSDLDGSLDSSFDASNESGPDVVEEAATCADAGAVSCLAGGFGTPALYSGDASAPCPSNYDTLDLTLATPTSPTCTCQCTDGGTAACDTTSVHYHLGSSDCTAWSGSLTLATGCTSATVNATGTRLSVDPPAVVGGCGGGTSTAPAATNTAVRLCVPRCASDESACTAQSGLQACQFATGSVATCPAGYPTGPFHVGNNPSVRCDPCTCAASGDCTGSQFHFYSSNDCSSGDQKATMDGTCGNTPGGGGALAFQSAKIVGNLTGYQCKVTVGNAHPSYGSGEATVCCR